MTSILSVVLAHSEINKKTEPFLCYRIGYLQINRPYVPIRTDEVLLFGNYGLSK